MGDDFEERNVRIIVTNGVITNIEEISRTPDIWIFPGFFNAHTHLGDTIAMDIDANGPIGQLVAPPDGLKHRLLRAATPAMCVEAMNASIRTMADTGTYGFADFREGGVEGARYLQEANAECSLDSAVFGRDGGEKISDGLGVSSTRHYGEGLTKIIEESRADGRIIAFHAGEKDAMDVDSALAFDPDMLIHCTHATSKQIRTIADAGIPVVICPRSNWKLGVTSSGKNPPVHEMIDAGIELWLGTDNVMFVQPDMSAEMSFCHYVYGIDAQTIMKMAVGGAHILDMNYGIHEQNTARFNRYNTARLNAKFSKNILNTIINRLNPLGLEGSLLN
ncbi:amidohydrolase family protein [Methanogenium organophilum]|uniref:Amidohydrolase family protein n=1 Tax=Methanogenium organophilum TaxID=2199 RepID=A0A9X9S6H2_METOG|nr:amidohydrolase family protein [Methanogenium organophilum]WAI02613.1 amidohydrolase family protein [Methanogenium organophilum]